MGKTPSTYSITSILTMILDVNVFLILVSVVSGAV